MPMHYAIDKRNAVSHHLFCREFFYNVYFTVYIDGMLSFSMINLMKGGLMLRVMREATRSVRNLHTYDKYKCADKGILSSCR